MIKKIVSIFSIAVLAGCGGKVDDSVIRIGEYGSMTGPSATYGTSTHNGIVLAIDEINAEGGIKGKQLKLYSEDDRGLAEEAKLAVTKLISKNKVHAVLGEVASTRSLAAAPVAQKYKVPMISPSSTNPGVTATGDYIFRVCFIDPFQGWVMAKFATANIGAETAAIFRDTANDYSVGLADVFRKEFTAMGGRIVTDQSYIEKDADFKAQLTKIKSANPDVIFVPGYYGDVGLIAKQARELGLTQPLLGGDGWDSAQLFKIGGSALDGCFYSNHYSSQSQDPRVIEFIAKYKEKHKEVPDALATLGYDAAKILGEALKNAKSLDTADIRDAIAATKNYPGVTGNITINAERNAIKPAVVSKITGGKALYVTTIAP